MSGGTVHPAPMAADGAEFAHTGGQNKLDQINGLTTSQSCGSFTTLTCDGLVIHLSPHLGISEQPVTLLFSRNTGWGILL